MATKEERQAEAKRAGANLAGMAAAIGLTPEDFFDAVKRQCVSGKPEDVAKVTAADFVAFFHTARQYGLDPLRKEIQIIPTTHGPRVYVTFDGWMRVLVSHPDYKAHGWTYNWADEKKKTLESVTCWIARKSMSGTPYEVSEHSEFMAECRNTDNSFTPWNKWPIRMLAEKAAMQAIRFTFAMYVPDLDDVVQAESGEAARDEHMAKSEPAAPPAQGPIAPAAAIPGAKRATRKKADEPAGLPAPDPTAQSVDEFLRGKSEPVPVAAHGNPAKGAASASVPGWSEDHREIGAGSVPQSASSVPFTSGQRVRERSGGQIRIVSSCEPGPLAGQWIVRLGNGDTLPATGVEIAQAIPETAPVTERASLPVYDPAESLRLDRELAQEAPSDGLFDDIV